MSRSIVSRLRGAVSRLLPDVVREADLSADRIITARMHDAGFPRGDSHYKALAAGSDGCLYFVIGSRRVDTHAQMFVFSPADRRVTRRVDLGAAVGEGGQPAVPQGKVHVELLEHEGRFYTATHIGFYEIRSSVEQPGRPPGYAPYPGGHFLAYDLVREQFDDLAKAPVEEGIIAMAMDPRRGRLYGVTWPGGLFLCYDLATRTLESRGPVFGAGERGRGRERMVINRSFGLDPRDGNVYWSNTRGDILVHRCATQAVERLTGCHLRLPSFGEPSFWRSIVWAPRQRAFYGIHATSSRLFRFDPWAERVEPLERLCAAPYGETARSWRRPPTPTLAYRLGPDQETLYALATGPGLVARDGRRVRSTVHLVTYDIPTGTCHDHGVLRLTDGRYPTAGQAIETQGGRLYGVPWIELPPSDTSARADAIRHARRGVGGSAAGRVVEEVNLIEFALPGVGSPPAAAVTVPDGNPPRAGTGATE